MNHVRERVARIRAKRVELESQYPEGCCVLVSLPNDTFHTVGGLVMEVDLETAARNLVDTTHRLAKPEEITAFREAQEVARKRILAEETVRRGVIIVRQPPQGGSRRG